MKTFPQGKQAVAAQAVLDTEGCSYTSGRASHMAPWYLLKFWRLQSQRG